MVKEAKHYWSDCGQILFLDGYGYGVDNSLQTVRLGKEVDILTAFETGKINSDLGVNEKITLGKILEYREENGLGIRKTDLVGTSNDGTIGDKQTANKVSTPRKRIALRTPYKKHKDLLRRRGH